ncbi:hemin-degrading factor [Commensalibacter papalotli (ex Botero et al. 2024)]|uniref:Heme degradation protein (HemS) (PDB:1U9T) n=1 Tax=Commensalibacter papalotli (ex Botero et al. 2024) TaxID=2972766 RepID=A0ABM9HHX8_9PROT|nr:ChuX/HutX family heme-like substrate-binding protein [Commensalibacter papalotli (ex Botero et al. 2024)]CAI3923135.1 Putative heme degradation protein (HemS) (PDB:1U9T) [Commensalibacter papalotli (ex Botero et al. 2024)]
MNAYYQRYLTLKAEHTNKFARDLATMIGISEAELCYARIGADVKPFSTDFAALLKELHKVGETMNIVRNEYAVHEQAGQYDNVKLGNHGGLVLNPRALDQRLFVSKWVSSFYIKEMTKRGEKESIQIFDAYGDAILKIYMTDNTNRQEWDALVTQFVMESLDQFLVSPHEHISENLLFDAKKIEEEWRAMTDVHQFFNLLNRHNVTRQQAFSSVSDTLACQVDNSALSEILNLALNDGNEIMIFIGNRGCVQIFTGVIEKLMPKDNWLNIFNPKFTMHLMEDQIAETWVTRKPTKEGYVTSLELFAKDGTQIAQLYGQRTEGDLEQETWRNQIDAVALKAKVA